MYIDGALYHLSFPHRISWSQSRVSPVQCTLGLNLARIGAQQIVNDVDKRNRNHVYLTTTWVNPNPPSEYHRRRYHIGLDTTQFNKNCEKSCSIRPLQGCGASDTNSIVENTCINSVLSVRANYQMLVAEHNSTCCCTSQQNASAESSCFSYANMSQTGCNTRMRSALTAVVLYYIMRIHGQDAEGWRYSFDCTITCRCARARHRHYVPNAESRSPNR